MIPHLFRVAHPLPLLVLLALPVRAQDYPGMVMPYGPIHVFVPAGFDLSTSRVRATPGQAEILVLEPRDGMVSGHPNAGFVSLTLYAFEISAEEAVERVSEDLRDTFGEAERFSVTPEDLYVGGEPREGVRIEFGLGEIDLVANAAGWQMAPDLTVVAYYQGRPQDVEELRPVIQQILASVGPGPAPSPELPASQISVEVQAGTGEGSGASGAGSESSSPSHSPEGSGSLE